MFGRAHRWAAEHVEEMRALGTSSRGAPDIPSAQLLRFGIGVMIATGLLLALWLQTAH